MTLVLLDTDTFGAVDLSPITDLFNHWAGYPNSQPDQVVERLASATVVVTNKVVITEATLAACPMLKLICVAATGVNNVDLSAAARRGIAVTNVPGYSTASVVSHTFAMYFHLAHHNNYHDRYTKDGGWCQSAIFTHLAQPYNPLANKTWGIIGLGAIGRAVAGVAAAFGCRVVYHSPSNGNLNQPWPHLSLDELLRQSQVVSIHTPLNQFTRSLLDKKHLAMMPADAILINTSRGGIVVETDLAQHLNEHAIAGAALDVLEQEPPNPQNPLWRVTAEDRLFITPHIAGLSTASREQLVAQVGVNINAFLSGDAQNRVTG